MLKKPKENFEKFCPNCNSTDLELFQSGITYQFKCKKCGWIGHPLEKKILK